MNKNYRTIWNEALGAWVAASEIDSARGKPTKRAAIAIVAAPLILASQVALAQYAGGYLSNAQGGGSIAIGGNGASTNAYGNDDVAIGSGAGADSRAATGGIFQPATAVGYASYAAVYGAAFGATAWASGTNATAIGSTATATATGGTAIGFGSSAGNNNAVALGSGSVTSAAVATSSVMLNGTTYSFAGTTPNSTVSVGASGAERTITNVAAGRITAASTDVVNGSQLYATNQALTAVGSSVSSLSTAVGAATATTSSITSLSTSLSSTNSSVSSL
ncbi:ESPR-type extended signal peptide-containing protein, partial [Burkholderia ubonensis]|uniref:ESPR-type extended signal peptide-containing protein n=1 Tax=Burkholderia ubonensis TaxID=101571 RepID=UPI0039F213CC